MRYANKTNGQIFLYGTLLSTFPNVTFSTNGPDQAWLDENNYAVLVENSAPQPPVYKVYEENGAEESSGEWHIKWLLRDMTTEEIDSYHKMIGEKIVERREALERTIIEYDAYYSYCDKESVTGIDECINNIMDNGGEKDISWGGPMGYTVASLESLSGLRKKVVDYRQKTRDAERLTMQDHLDAPFTTIENAILAFDAYMED